MIFVLFEVEGKLPSGIGKFRFLTSTRIEGDKIWNFSKVTDGFKLQNEINSYYSKK